MPDLLISVDMSDWRLRTAAPWDRDRESRLLFHQEHGTAALDLARDLAMQMRRHTRNAARQNLAAFGNEFLQEIGILVVDCLQRDVDAAARHRAVGATKGGAAFGCFWLHGDLLRFAVKSVSAQKWIVFLLLQSIRGARTFLVSRAHIARDRLTQRFGLGAFEGDNFLRHGDYSFAS